MYTQTSNTNFRKGKKKHLRQGYAGIVNHSIYKCLQKKCVCKRNRQIMTESTTNITQMHNEKYQRHVATCCRPYRPTIIA